ncbi:MAG: cysteine hydrolase [Chloroflexota bacterium]|nr:MAG: cysteine hydrolase [Chloroflexota bacterium]
MRLGRAMPEPFALDLDAVLNRRYPIVDRLDPARTALIVVDMQRFFLEPDQPAYLPGGDGAPSAEAVVENTVRAVDLCRRHGIPVIWSRWGLRGDGWDVGRWAPKWPTWHAGTPQGPAWENPATEIVPQLKPAPGEPVFEKSRYSSFWGTPLDSFLQHLPTVDSLIILGVTTGFCVRYTVEDAFSRDYKVVVIADCTTAINDPLSPDNPGSGQYVAALRDFAIGLGDVWTLAELTHQLE